MVHSKVFVPTAHFDYLTPSVWLAKFQPNTMSEIQKDGLAEESDVPPDPVSDPSIN